MVRLVGQKYDIEAWVEPERGHRLAGLSFRGQNVLHHPGMPFLAPWANRIPNGFHVDGEFHPFDPPLGNLQIDPATGCAIHGLLWESPLWEVVRSARTWITSRLEFWRHEALMSQWPFAHEYEMTFRIANGGLEVMVEIRNLAKARMPVAIGFHPYFTIPGVPRAEWQARIPARMRVVHDDKLLATGELLPSELPEMASLAKYWLNSGYTGLESSPRFRIEGRGRVIGIHFEPEWPVAIVWGPEGKEFLCVEPMTTVTDGINLHHRGLWPALQWIAPGGAWRGGFRISGHGF